VGSRRGRYAALVALALGGACTAGAPPGFAGSKGDRWALPLVGSLENGLLLTPVTLDGKGPYLFAIDPDADISAIDEQVLKETSFRTFRGPSRLDESDTQQIRFYAEVSGIEVGTLIVERRNAMIVKLGTFDREGRRIHGLLGRDIIPDSLVFGFDRDQGLAQLVVKKSFKPPADAIKISYEVVPSQIPNIDVQPVSRRLAKATIAGETFAMHLDLGEQLSTLRESLWDKAKLTAQPARAGSIDEVGVPHKIEKAGVGQAVTVGAATVDKLAFAPYEDKRWPEQDVSGTLALDFLRGYNVWLDWDGKALYLAPREPVPLAKRIARWDTGALGKCPHPGCVEVRMIDPMAGREIAPGAPHPGVILSVTRDEPAGGMDLEVVLEAKDRPELPRLVVNMSPNGDRVMDHLKAEWAGVTLTVVDASPFPRACTGATGCVDVIAR
jgi:hypothetical protein